MKTKEFIKKNLMSLILVISLISVVGVFAGDMVFSESGGLEVDGNMISTGANAGIIVGPRDASGNAFQWYNPTGNELRLWSGSDLFTIDSRGNIKVTGTYKSSDGSSGYTGNCGSETTLIVKDGLIIGCS